MTAVLHTWGSAMTHHPHLHCIVPGGGLSLDGERWVACKPGFLLPVKVLSKLFRRLCLEGLRTLHAEGRLDFFAKLEPLQCPKAFAEAIAPLRRVDWYVDGRAPFAGPAAVLAYLSRYTHRVAIANSRLIDYDGERVSFRWKDYRAPQQRRYKTMSLETDEFIRRFLIHVLPRGFHRIRHYGLFANGQRGANLERARRLLQVHEVAEDDDTDDAVKETEPPWRRCPSCGAVLRIVEVFLGTVHRGHDPP
jgi:hypothetical protein